MKRYIILFLCLLLIISSVSLPTYASNVQAFDLISTAVRYYGSSDAMYGTSYENAFDSNNDTLVYLNPESNEIGGWFAIELAHTSILTKIAMVTRSSGDLGECSGFIFEAANNSDFSDADILYMDTRESSELSCGQTIAYNIYDNTKTYKFVRIRRIKSTADQYAVMCFSGLSIAGIAIDDAVETKNLSGNATYISSAAKAGDGDFIYANDGKNAYGQHVVLWGSWSSTTYFGYDLHYPCTITKIAIDPPAIGRDYKDIHRNCVIEGANKSDFSDAVTLATTGTDGGSQEFSISDDNTYRYIRIRKLPANAGDAVGFGEFAVYGISSFDYDYNTEEIVNSSSGGYYALTFDAMSADGAIVNIINNSIPQKNIVLTNSGCNYYTKQYALVKLNEGINTLGINCAAGKVSINNIATVPLNNISDKDITDFVGTVNKAITAFELKDILMSKIDDFGISYMDTTGDIFYDIPIYENMTDKVYRTADEIINDFISISILEKSDPTVIVARNGEAQTKLESGDYIVTVKNKRLKEPCRVVVAVYNGDSLAGVGHMSSNDSGVVTIPLSVNLLDAGDVSFKVMYIDDFDNLRPIDAYPEIYENIYMSSSGSDDGDGSEQNPYATLDAVKARIAEINDNMTGDIVVHVEDGTYPLTETVTFTEEYGGKNGYNVIIAGDGVGDNPVFTGGIEVTGWTEYRDGIYKAPLDIEGDVRNLYINGYGATRARSSYKYKLDELYNDMSTSYENDGFYASTAGIPKFSKPEELELVWNLSWQAHRTPVESIEESDGRYLFHMNNPSFSTAYHSSTSDITIKNGSSFYIENAIELLDEEGEFYYDGTYIYYKPYPEETLSECEVCVPITETLFDIGGSSYSSKIKNLTFRNLDIRLGAWNMVSTHGLMGVQSELIYDMGTGSTTMIHAQLNVNNADNIHFVDCNISNMGSTALRMQNAVTNSSVRECSFTDISGSAVSIGNAKLENINNAYKSTDIKIEDNVFRRVSSEYHQTIPIAAYHGNGIVIKHNDIKNTPYSAINTGWGWENYGEITDGTSVYPPDGCGYYDVSNNKISDSMLVLADGAAIYNLDGGPSVISGNYIDNSGGSQQLGIYPDSSSRNLTIFNNVAVGTRLWLQTGMYYTKNIKAYDNYSDTGWHDIMEHSTEEQMTNAGIFVENAIKISDEAEELSGNATYIASAAKAGDGDFIYANDGKNVYAQHVVLYGSLSSTTYFGYDLHYPCTITKIVIDPPAIGRDYKDIHRNCVIEGANKSDFSDAVTLAATGTVGGSQEFSIANDNTYRYIRIRKLAANAGDAVGFGEFTVYGIFIPDAYEEQKINSGLISDRILRIEECETPSWRKEATDSVPWIIYTDNGYLLDATRYQETNCRYVTAGYLSFRNGNEVCYHLPELEAGTYALSIIGANGGSKDAIFYGYYNNSFLGYGTIPANVGKWGDFVEASLGNIDITSNGTHILKISNSSEGFNFSNLKLVKIN